MNTNNTTHIAIPALLNQMKMTCGGGFTKPELAGIGLPDLKGFILSKESSDADICNAMGLLSRVEITKEVVALLEKIACDQDRNLSLRLSAVLALYHQEHKVVEPAMIRLLHKANLDLQHRVIPWLGCHGSAAAHDELGAAGKRMPEYLQERLQNSQSLIAYRHNLDRGILDLSKAFKPKFKGALKKKALVHAKAPKSKERTVFTALGYDLEQGLSFQPEGCEWEYSFFQRKDMQSALKAVHYGKKQVLGALTYFDHRAEAQLAMHYVLAGQVGKEIEVALMNPKGWLTFTGTLQGSTLWLSSTNRHAGHYSEIKVDLDDLSGIQMFEAPGTFKKRRPLLIKD